MPVIVPPDLPDVYDESKPEVLDFPAYESFIHAAERGGWLFAGIPGEGAFDAFEASTQAEFETEFLAQIAQVVSFRTDMDDTGIRARALGNTTVAMRERAKKALEESKLMGAPIPLDHLDLWIDQRLSRMRGSYTPAQQAALALGVMVTAADFALIAGMTINHLSMWRQRGIGPSWVKPTSSEASIRYPLLAVREWIDARTVTK
jgi:hypothetical protein